MLRRWTESDLLAISELECECFANPWSLDMLKSEINCLGFVGFVYEREGEILGYIGATTVLDEANLDLIAVSPNHRRKGYAKLLINALFAELNLKGITKTFLEVRRKNLAAINLYTSLGFIAIGERLNYYGDDDAIIMVKLKEGTI